MISIYVLTTESLKSQSFDFLVEALPFGDAEKRRLMSLGNDTRRWESLGGLTALLRLVKSIAPSEIMPILRAENGKPHFDGSSPIPFSISHSHGICAAAIATGGHCEIGLDIEVIDSDLVRLGVAERFFSPEEKLRFELSEKSAESFFAIWTAKEACSKLDGSGLASLAEIKETSGDTPVYVSQLTIEQDVRRIMVSVCSHISNEAIRIYSDSEVIK